MVHYGPQLFKLNQNLMMLALFEEDPNGRLSKLSVFNLGFANQHWVRHGSLPGCSLFINRGGKSPSSSCMSEEWQGRTNTAYVTGPDCDSYIILHVGDTLRPELTMGDNSPVSVKSLALDGWPSNIWSYHRCLPI